jgi:hypothetical protein
MLWLKPHLSWKRFKAKLPAIIKVTTVLALTTLGNVTQIEMILIGLYYPLDGITNLKYKLLCFLTPNKIIF